MPLEREDQVESNDLNLNQLCFWILNHFDAMLYDWRCANLVHFIFLSFLPSFLPSFLRSLTPSSSQVVCHLLCFFMTLLSLPFFLLSHSCSFRAIPQSILSLSLVGMKTRRLATKDDLSSPPLPKQLMERKCFLSWNTANAPAQSCHVWRQPQPPNATGPQPRQDARIRWFWHIQH